MSNPRLQHLPPERSAKPEVHSLFDTTAKEYAYREARFKKRIIEKYGLEAAFDVPYISPLRIIDQLQHGSMGAAFMLKEASSILVKGHHKRIQEYILVGYLIALAMKTDSNAPEWLAGEVFGEGGAKAAGLQKVKKKPLTYLFIFMFSTSGLTTRNRATQYAETLQYFYDNDEPASKVETLLKKYGQEKLRRAGSQWKEIKAARALADDGGTALPSTMTDLLEEMQKEEPAPEVHAEETTDYGPREIPPDQYDCGGDDPGTDDDGDGNANEVDCPSMDRGGRGSEVDGRDVKEGQVRSDLDLSIPDDEGEFFDPKPIVEGLNRQVVAGFKVIRAVHRSSCSSAEKKEIIKMLAKILGRVAALKDRMVIR